jgi:hypothetical protein
MSKKLIAVASAAALALSALVAAPAAASAGPFQVVTTVGQQSGTGVAAGASALNILVPSQDVLREDAVTTATSTGTLSRVTIQTTVEAAQVELVSSSPSTRMLTSTQCASLSTLNSTSGVDKLTVVSNSSADAVFCVLTTTTANTTITATQVGTANVAVIHVRGVSPKKNGYKMSLTTGTTTTSPSGVIKVNGTVVDMFGNVLTGHILGDFTFTGLGLPATPTVGEFVANATTGAFSFEVTNRATTGAGAFNVVLAATALADAQTRFGTRADSLFVSTNAVDLTALVTSLNAQVAALTADYNALVKKWNKRVDSRKAPKKKAALK